MEAPTGSVDEGREDSTPTPTRKAQVANLREKRATLDADSDTASISSDVTVLKHEPSIGALSDASSSSGNEVYTTHGLQLALKATIRPPTSGVLTERELKSEYYRTDTSDHHDRLLAQLDSASDAYETIAAKRERHDHDADPAKGATLDREFLEANNKLSKAEREYHGYVGYINELRAMPQMTRAESKLYHERKRQERQDLAQESEQHQPCNEKLRTFERQAKKNQESIAYLTEQLRIHELDAMRSILAQRRELTEMSEQNRKLASDAAKLTTVNRDLKCLNGFLTRQNESFENHPGYCNPAWEDPKAQGLQNAMAARRLAMAIAMQQTGSNVAVATEPIKDTMSEILRVQEMLVKHGVVEEVPLYAQFNQAGKSQNLPDV